MTTLNVTLPAAVAEFVESRVGDGRFATTDEYLVELIRRDRVAEGERKLAALLEEGIASGPVIPVDEAFWAELRAVARGQR